MVSTTHIGLYNMIVEDDIDVVAKEKSVKETDDMTDNNADNEVEDEY